MARRLWFALVLVLMLLVNLTPGFAIYNDCSQYVTMVYTDSRGVSYCNFCRFQGGWSDMQTGESYCSYSCFGYSLCQTA